MTINKSKSKLDVQFQYGRCRYPETGSSYILALNWDISQKFGAQVDNHLLTRVPLRNLNPEIDFRFYGRYLEKSAWRQTPPQNDIPITTESSKSKPEIQFQYGGFPFSETGSCFISAIDWDVSSKFGTQTDFHLLKRMQPLTLNSEVAFGLYGRHLENRYDVITSPAIVWLRRNLAGWRKITCRWLHIGQNRNKRYNSNVAAIRFPKPEVCYKVFCVKTVSGIAVRHLFS